MVNIILGLCVGIVLFLCCIKSYILGLKHGKQLANKEIPVMESIKEIAQHFEINKEVKKVESGIDGYWG
jgi:hypothetical protein